MENLVFCLRDLLTFNSTNYLFSVPITPQRYRSFIQNISTHKQWNSNISYQSISWEEEIVQMLFCVAIFLVRISNLCCFIIHQGLLELLWTVYSEGKLQSCLKLWNFQNPFNKDKSVLFRSIRHTMHKKGLKFALVVELEWENLRN